MCIFKLDLAATLDVGLIIVIFSMDFRFLGLAAPALSTPAYLRGGLSSSLSRSDPNIDVDVAGLLTAPGPSRLNTDEPP